MNSWKKHAPRKMERNRNTKQAARSRARIKNAKETERDNFTTKSSTGLETALGQDEHNLWL